MEHPFDRIKNGQRVMISVHPETELNRGGDREQDGIKEYNENGTRMRLLSLTTSQFQESVIN